MIQFDVVVEDFFPPFYRRLLKTGCLLQLTGQVHFPFLKLAARTKQEENVSAERTEPLTEGSPRVQTWPAAERILRCWQGCGTGTAAALVHGFDISVIHNG